MIVAFGERETQERLTAQLAACEASALAFCRLLERWAKGQAEPGTVGGRQAALRVEPIVLVSGVTLRANDNCSAAGTPIAEV